MSAAAATVAPGGGTAARDGRRRGHASLGATGDGPAARGAAAAACRAAGRDASVAASGNVGLAAANADADATYAGGAGMATADAAEARPANAAAGDGCVSQN